MLNFWYTMGFVTTVLSILNWVGVLAVPWVWVTAPLWAPLAVALIFSVLLNGLGLVLVALGGGDAGTRR